MYDTIVVPTDGSEFSERAAEQARDVATAFDATVHAVSVVDEDAATSVFEQGDVTDALREQLRAEGEAAIDTVEAVLDDAAVPVESALVDGEPAESIVGYAEDVDADLLVMGTHGRTGVNRYVAGSVTERVLRRSPVPVLTIRDEATTRPLEDYDDVLVPTDGSDAAEVAIEHALALAGPGDATVHAVNVIDIGALAGTPGATPPETSLESLQTAGEDATATVADVADAADLPVQTAVRKGAPGHVLLEYADEHDVDVVTMGTTGRTGLDRYLLGSTTERLVRHADQPVLAVNTRNGE